MFNSIVDLIIVSCPVCNQQFSVCLIEEHANESLERRRRRLFSGVIEINSDSESEQHSSPDNQQTISDNEKEPIIEESLDTLTRKIQIVIGICKMEKYYFLQLNIRRGYCFQDFTKAFRNTHVGIIGNLRKRTISTRFDLLEKQE